MVFDEYFLIIPVYRISEEQYYSDLEDNCERSIPKTWNEDFRKDHSNIIQGFKENHRSVYGGDWEFNEIVGYIKLHF